MAKKPSGNTQMTLWDEEFAKEAEAARQTRAPAATGQSIGTRGGVLTFGGEPIEGNKLQCVLLSRLYFNAFYEGEFDPETPRSPVCYAYADMTWAGAEIAKLMKPHDEAVKKQAERCLDCENNRWGSSDRGKGKACQNRVRLALLPRDALESKDDLAAATLAFIQVPVTSVANYHAYEELVSSSVKRPTWGVVTEIMLKPDPKRQFTMEFKMVDKINDAKLLPTLKERVTSSKTDIASPFPQNSEADAKPKKSDKKAKFVKAKPKANKRK